MSTETLTRGASHLAWCAMAALHLARQDGLAQSESQENLFLTRWLAIAQKQRRFPRDVAPDIEWLLKQGRTLGVQARLRQKLDYLWRSCTGELSQQNDLFRLTYALETAKEMRWTYRLLANLEWSGRHAVSLNAGVNGVYISRTSLDAAFNDDGRQLLPLLAKVTGGQSGLATLFDRCGWQIETHDDAAMPFVVSLMAKRA